MSRDYQSTDEFKREGDRHADRAAAPGLQPISEMGVINTLARHVPLMQHSMAGTVAKCIAKRFGTLPAPRAQLSDAEIEEIVSTEAAFPDHFKGTDHEISLLLLGFAAGELAKADAIRDALRSLRPAAPVGKAE